MVESLFFLGGAILGAVAVHTGYFAGTKVVYKTYVELTQTPEELLNTIDKEQQQGRPELPEGYDWDTYDSYIERSKDEDDVIPES